MKRFAMILVMLMVLSGCSANQNGMERAMQLRTSLLNGQGCIFTAEITADFGKMTYEFTLSCETDGMKRLQFQVSSPEYIEGITGYIDADQGKLTFDDTVLVFPLQADTILSPVSGPWIMLKALSGGYVRSITEENGLFRVTVDDSFREDALMLDVWLDETNCPVRADIYEEGRRIMVLEIRAFRMK